MSAKVKVWRVRPEAAAHFEVHEDECLMVGNDKNLIAVNSSGITLKGPLSIACMGESRRVGGFFVETNEFLKMIPSTIVTPIPQVMVMPPLGFVKNIAQSVIFAMAFLV